VEGVDFSKEMFNVMKTIIDGTASMLSMMQNQNERILNLVVEHSLTTQKEGKKMLDEWVKKARNSNEIYKKLLEENLRRVFQMNAAK
jgi:polyhydroxyalkanoate synthesis regulator phasin